MYRRENKYRNMIALTERLLALISIQQISWLWPAPAKRRLVLLTLEQRR